MAYPNSTRWAYPLLFGMAAAALCMLIWGIAEPFWWMGPPLCFGFIGVFFAQKNGSGAWPSVAFSVLPLLALAILFSLGKPLSVVWVSLPALALFSGVGAWWWELRQPGNPAELWREYGLPVLLGVAGMVLPLFLFFAVAMLSAWPWPGVPPNAVFLPPVLALLAALLARQPRRRWWHDALMLCLPALALFVVLPLTQGNADPRNLLDASRVANWQMGAALLCLPLTGAVSYLISYFKAQP